MAQTDDFTAAFNGEDVQQVAQTEDEAFGIMPEEPEVTEESQAIPEAIGDAESSAEGDSGTDGEAPAVVIAVEPSETPVAEDDMPTDPKDIQRMKSWEGRLKAREAELKAREEAISKPAAVDGESAAPAAAVEEAVEAVKNGDMSIEQAMSGLADTFGEDFTSMISVLIEKQAYEIASKTADDRYNKARGDVESLAKEITEEKRRNHFESIADAHPDFMDIASSPEFKSYVDGMDDMQKPKVMQVIQNGSAAQINKLLTTYKQSQNKVDAPQDDPAMDAAEGVRSKGMKIPTKPTDSQDFAEAWAQF